MKKHLLPLALILFLATPTKAQTSVYHPFPDSNAVWTEQNGSWDGSVYCSGSVFSVFIKGDTVIAGTAYHKCFESGSDFGCYSATTYFSNLYMYAIRQDTSQKKVFAFLWNDSTESLLYDFNLSLGDTLPLSVISPANSPYVSSTDSINSNYVSKVDSIFVGNGFRKRFWISGIPVTSNDTNYFSIIEGIGSDQGLIDVPIPPSVLVYTGQYSQLNCFNEDEQTLWFNPSVSSCVIQTGVNELSQQVFISLYPNPTTNQLTIQTSLDNNEAATVSIINMLGERMLSNAVSFGEGRGEVFVGSLPAGIYFVQLTAEKERWVGKFVKQ